MKKIEVEWGPYGVCIINRKDFSEILDQVYAVHYGFAGL